MIQPNELMLENLLFDTKKNKIVKFHGFSEGQSK